jgi:uncharacterized paraquat-inducible protein A
MWIVVAVAVAAVLVGGFLFMRLRRTAEEEIFHFNCPSCKRRFRFPAKLIGQSAACPRCRTRFTFPNFQGK